MYVYSSKKARVMVMVYPCKSAPNQNRFPTISNMRAD